VDRGERIRAIDVDHYAPAKPGKSLMSPGSRKTPGSLEPLRAESTRAIQPAPSMTVLSWLIGGVALLSAPGLES
jgi:hypothetical protein